MPDALRIGELVGRLLPGDILKTETDTAEDLSVTEIFRKVWQDLGGILSGEHGVGVTKAR